MIKRTYVKTTQDGRVVEVIGGEICLDGRPEAKELVDVSEHPNRQAIQRAVPRATHMAGRLPLTEAEAAIASGALAEHNGELDSSPAALDQRLRRAYLRRAMMEGIE